MEKDDLTIKHPESVAGSITLECDNHHVAPSDKAEGDTCEATVKVEFICSNCDHNYEGFGVLSQLRCPNCSYLNSASRNIPCGLPFHKKT